MGVCVWGGGVSGYAFRYASRYGAETWYGDRGQAPEAQEHIFEVNPSKVKGHPEVKLLRNALWVPNLIGRTPVQSVMHYWGQRLCTDQQGSTRGQFT